MGQAKRRGTREQRIVEGKAKALEKQRIAREREALREASLTSEERLARDRMRLVLSMSIGLGVSGGGL